PIDHRTDVYSLGAALYELASGQPVFDAESPHAILSKIIAVEPVPPRKVNPNLPRDLETIILKCLAKEPNDRYQTARDLADDLRRFVAGDPIRARRPTLFDRGKRWIRKRQQGAAVLSGSVVLAVVAAVLGLQGWRQYEEDRKGRLSLLTDGPHFR